MDREARRMRKPEGMGEDIGGFGKTGVGKDEGLTTFSATASDVTGENRRPLRSNTL